MSTSLAPDSGSRSPVAQIFTQVILGLLVPGLGLTTVLLTLYGYAAWNPVSRPYLDRVSFRLLTYALVAHLCFGILFAISAFATYNGLWCALITSMGNLCLVFSAGMFFSIAINLPLVLAFKVNGRKMEKYYVIGTMLIGIVSNFVPHIFGHLRWDETCWYGSGDPSAMLRWYVGAQIVWILLASFGEVISFTIILGYLVVYRLVPEDTPTSYPSTSSHRPGSTILRFRNIILRIGLYPLVSCILNISTSVIELCLFQNHQRNLEKLEQQNWRLDLADLAVYAGRPIIYGLLAATDPSFIRALRALRYPQNESETPSQIRTRGLVMSTIIYLPQDEISINAQGSSLEAQISGEEMSATSPPNINPAMWKAPLGGNGTPAPIDVVSHI
ncbi:hypothetical protein C8R45DRAFT_1032935 [Mycena sanguinolenta]|nr:hypothetical protein C8R45DRAFT_1032935 [Mycena sanguinolenta]